MQLRISLSAVALALVLGACGSGTSGPPDDSLATLVIEPATAELLIQDSTPARQLYTATLAFPDGTTRDVTDETSFIVDSGFGSFTLNDLAMGNPGKTAVYGTFVDKTASAQVIARFKSVRVDPSLSATTPDWFTGPETATDAPTMVYPPADVVIPRNLGDFETHWTSAGALDVFEVSLKTEFTDVRVYVPGGNGVAGSGPNPSWTAFAATEWLAAVGRENSITYQVRGVATANPTSVSAAAPRRAKLSNGTMEGGLYYWASTSSAGGATGIFRHDMSKPGEPAEEFMTTTQTGGRCVACHVLSRDGEKMAIVYQGGNGPGTIVDLATSAMLPEAANWNFGTFTPDNTQYLTVLDGTLTVRDAATLAALSTMPSAGLVSHPDISPDGTQIVYVRTGTRYTDYSFGGGQVFTRSYDAVTQTFGAETPLVIDGANNFYPSWSPDGQWIVFNRSDDGSPDGAYDDVNAQVWIVKADGSAPAFELTTGNQALGLTNSWARWAPFESTTGASGEPLFWITVSSKRDFGTRLLNTGVAEGSKFPQLWMTAFYPGRVGTSDPGSPAFRLPFQGLTTRNHIGQWTEKVVVVQ